MNNDRGVSGQRRVTQQWCSRGQSPTRTLSEVIQTLTFSIVANTQLFLNSPFAFGRFCNKSILWGEYDFHIIILFNFCHIHVLLVDVSW